MCFATACAFLHKNIWMKKIVTIVVLMWLAMGSFAQRVTINGYVSDAESGERLIGATVYDTVSHRGVVTNNSGFYSLTIPANKVALQVSYVGYRPSKVNAFRLTQDTLLNFNVVSNSQLDEVVVVGAQSVSSPMSAQMSAIDVPVDQIKTIPMIAGEVDVLKAIQLLPGVQSGTEGSAGLYVRGGGPDENLVILDGVPLYNVNHLMGFFSVFNADAVKNVTLYKGNFPSQYGGRLSSIIDVRQNDGNAQGYHGNVSVGLLAAKANFEGPIPHKKPGTGSTTFNVSARRTYFDLFVSPIVGVATAASNNGDVSILPGAYFYDVNAKLTHTFANQNDKLSASYYMGDDAVYFTMKSEAKDEGQTSKTNVNMRMSWGNILAALNWEHRFTPRLFANTQLSYTRYRYRVKEGMTQKTNDKVSPLKFEQSMNYNSNIRDVMLQSNFSWAPLSNNTLHFGAIYTYHQFRPEVMNFYLFGADVEDPSLQFNVNDTISDGSLHGHEVAAYVEDSWSPWEWLKLNVGARASVYCIDGKVYPSIEPRVGVRALLYKDLSLKVSYSYTTQHIHLLTNTSISLPTDLWVPVTKDIAPMHSMIVAAGLSYNICGQVEASVEGYYKRATNLLEYKEGASFFGSTTGWQDKVSMGDGWSYGVEVLFQRKVGPVTGWVGYTWSRTMRQFDRPGQEINYGRPFHAKYDREHDLSIVLQYAINKRVDIAGTFVYGTGSRATFGSQEYYDPSEHKDIAFITERNNYKMPDYHRLDLGVNIHFPHNSKRAWTKDAEHLLNVSVYNAYCHANPYLMIPNEGKLYQLSLFPILPSISYSFKF